MQAATEIDREETHISPLDMLQVLWRKWWVIVVVFVATLGAAGAFTYYQSDVFRATARVFVQTDEPVSRLLGTVNSGFDPRLQTLPILLTSEEAIRAGLPYIYPEGVADERRAARGLQGNLSTTLIRDTNLLEVSYIAGDGAEAKRVVEGLLQGFPSYFAEQRQKILSAALVAAQALITSEQERIGEGSEASLAAEQAVRIQFALDTVRASGTGFSVSIVDSAVVSQVAPRPLLNLVAGGILGLVLGGSLAFALEYLNRKVRTEEDLRRISAVSVPGRISSLPVLGVVPQTVSEKDGVAPSLTTSPKSPLAESIRLLRANLQFTSVDTPRKTVLITSAEPAEGKTFIVANLARAFAQQGARVLAIDADLRRPRLTQALDVPPGLGLTHVIVGQAKIEDVLVEVDGLHLLRAGVEPPNPSEILGSQRMAEIMEWAASNHDIVLLDGAPTLGFADSVVLGRNVDAVVLVSRAERADRGALAAALRQLQRIEAPVVGTVLNGLNVSRRGGYGYYGYYSYSGYYSGNGSRDRRESSRGKRRGFHLRRKTRNEDTAPTEVARD